MKNTATYKVKVEFAWKYPGKPLQTVHKSGLVQTDKTEDKLIAEKFINSFINNYKHGICEVHDLKENILLMTGLKNINLLKMSLKIQVHWMAMCLITPKKTNGNILKIRT